MDIERFKIKHADLIKKGVIKFSTQHPYMGVIADILKKEWNSHDVETTVNALSADYIVIDRFDGEHFLADAKELNSPRSDAQKMGYQKTMGIGVYVKI